jgi:tetratricopeptide (TPR) repeat protein
VPSSNPVAPPEPIPPARGILNPIAICLALVIAVVFLYWPATRHEFINYDDQDYVTENAVVQNGLTWEGAWWALTTNHAGNWHPLTWLSHMLDGELFGAEAGGHHATSFILHALNSALVFLLLFRLTGSSWRSALVAALFALHPLRVESVAWVSERKDVLSAFFGLLTLLAYARYTECKIKNEKGKNTYYGVALLCFALGLMSKPMLVTWPFVMLLLDFWPLQRVRSAACGMGNGWGKEWARLVREKIPFFALTAVSCVVTFTVQQSAGAVATADAVPIITRLQNSLVSYAAYLENTCWPDKLAVLYPYAQTLTNGTMIYASALLIGIFALAIVTRRSKPYLLIGWLWYLGVLVPAVGLIQVGQQSMADRYTYLPTIGILVMVVWGVADLRLIKAQRSWAMAATGLALGILVGLAVASRRQLTFWKDSESLFTHALAVTTNNSVAHYSLGSALATKGRVPEAADHFREAIRINPQNQEAHSDLGLALVLEGKIAEGISHYEQAIAINPRRDKPYYNLARALSLQGRKAEAIPNYERVLELNPNHTEARMALASELSNLARWDEAAAQFEILTKQLPNEAEVYWRYGNMCRSQGDPQAAIEHYVKALPLAPNNAELHDSFGLALAQVGQRETALNHFQTAARLQPTAQFCYHLGLALNVNGQPEQAAKAYQAALMLEPNHLESLNDLAWMRATHSQAAVRNGAEAVTLAEQAVLITEGREARFLGTLDAAYAEANRFEEAIQAAQKTLTMARAQGQEQVAVAAEKRLRLYQQKIPYRQAANP